MQFLVQFMPMAQRIVQSYGLSLFNIRYWHPIFAAWRELRRKVVVRYHPDDLSRASYRPTRAGRGSRCGSKGQRAAICGPRASGSCLRR